MPRDIERARIKHREWRERNREQRNADARAWRKANLDSVNKTKAAYREKNREAINAGHEAWRKANPERYAAHQLAHNRHRRYVKRMPLMNAAERAEAEAMYEFCRLFPQFEVDHIIPLKGKNVSGLHVLGNLQVLPKGEHRRKGNKFDYDVLAPEPVALIFP